MSYSPYGPYAGAYQYPPAPASTSGGGGNTAIAALIPAVAGLAGAGLQYYGQQQAANQRPQQQQVPLPGYQDALQRITARALALNMMQTPPSFTDWVMSGGQAKFPIINPGITPKGTRDLGITSPTGGPVPFSYGPGGTPVGQTDLATGYPGTDPGSLSDTQKLYMGMQLWNSGDRKSWLAKAWMQHQKQKQIANRITQLNTAEQGAKSGKQLRIERQKEKLRGKAGRLSVKEQSGMSRTLPGEQGFDSQGDYGGLPYAGTVAYSGGY